MSAAAVATPGAPGCAGVEKHVDFTREDERRLEYLMRQKNEGLLASEEEAEFVALEEKHSAFIEEGVRRLHSGSPSDATTVSTAFDASAVASWVPTALSQTAGTVGRAAYFWTSLVGTAVPAIAKKVGLTDHFDHWNFVTDRLILGALPVVTQVGSFGNHLAQLKQQLADRNNTLGLIVACLGEEEMTGFGLQLVEFARESHWREQVSPDIEYIYLPMIDGTAEVTMEHVRTAVDRLHEVLDVKKQCAYVHCKAGKGRSWMVTMCYLATYGGRSFENAEALVCMARHQVNPSSAQREFAKDFCKKFQADEEAKKLLTESVEPE